MLEAVRSIIMVVTMLLISACGADASQQASTSPTSSSVAPVASADATPAASAIDGYADIEIVTVSGEPGSYTFAVTVRSPDAGCNRYADWWEVLSESGDLVYRRVLLHSHVDEQPFTRTGGSVDVGMNDIVIVRAHMSSTAYGGVAMRGTVTEGFSIAELPAEFAVGAETMEPLPTGCAF